MLYTLCNTLNKILNLLSILSENIFCLQPIFSLQVRLPNTSNSTVYEKILSSFIFVT